MKSTNNSRKFKSNKLSLSDVSKISLYISKSINQPHFCLFPFSLYLSLSLPKLSPLNIKVSQRDDSPDFLLTDHHLTRSRLFT